MEKAVIRMNVRIKAVVKDSPIKDRATINLIKQYYLNKKDYRNLLFFLLSINTGLKINDLLELNAGDVKGKDFLVVKHCLAGIKKRIPLNDEIKDVIAKVVKHSRKSDPLFISIRGKRLERTTVYNQFKDVCEELGLDDDISISSLRKTFGYHYYQKSKDLSFLQWLFNQSSVLSTMEYIGISENLSARFNPEFSL